ncbi:CopG family transcriptional regulator [Corynebacterium sp.]|uniref:CopG family transcriptional regulator n=1 Tax=Corynebacterium sp. TaxID=1720 RepID=UPI0026DA84BE|nr:CopG family transcriptional regulator [Corynebacterium sp.]MDO4609674.1 CopG family transcriptional regulator [Corynebacterium sp.]
MAMTLRLTQAQDAALTLLAEAQGTSKQTAAARAIVAEAARRLRHAEIRDLARREVADYLELHRRVRTLRVPAAGVDGP